MSTPNSNVVAIWYMVQQSQNYAKIAKNNDDLPQSQTNLYTISI